MSVMMECGHATNATSDGLPVCAICAPNVRAYTVASDPDLTDREARCGCGKIVPSSKGLAFFEYRGEGSQAATNMCRHCRYAEQAHALKPNVKHLQHCCDAFEPHGAWEYDTFYCGCRGWD